MLAQMSDRGPDSAGRRRLPRSRAGRLEQADALLRRPARGLGRARGASSAQAFGGSPRAERPREPRGRRRRRRGRRGGGVGASQPPATCA